MQALGMIQQVELRDIWPNEAKHFTTWLAMPDNLAQLSKAIGVELCEAEVEHSVGSFSLDILAKDADGNTVIIENQLEDTNHDHLGKLITYASGTDASLAVWIVKTARDEHQKAVEWLNEHTDMGIGFVLVEVSAIKINDSLPAALFSVIEAPNDWAKAVKATEGMKEGDKLRLSYWQTYTDIAKEHAAFSKRFNVRKPQTWNWTTVSCGDSRYQIELSIASEDKTICATLYIPNNKDLGAKVESCRADFEAVMGMEATLVQGEKASGLRFYRHGCEIRDNQTHWPEYISWQLESALALRAKFEELGL